MRERGDGGDSNPEGQGEDTVDLFHKAMMDRNRKTEQKFDEEEVEESVKTTDLSKYKVEGNPDKIVCDLPGAPPGWLPPGRPEDYRPRNIGAKFLPFEEIDNPGNWSKYTFRPAFARTKKVKKGGDELKAGENEPMNTGKVIQSFRRYETSSGAGVVPVNMDTGKRTCGPWEFFYNGWDLYNDTFPSDIKNEQSRETGKWREHFTRPGTSTEDYYPDHRSSVLDCDYLQKMGLTRERMENKDTLFFKQLLTPICDPCQSGIENDPRMTYYNLVAKFTSMKMASQDSYSNTFRS